MMHIAITMCGELFMLKVPSNNTGVIAKPVPNLSTTKFNFFANTSVCLLSAQESAKNELLEILCIDERYYEAEIERLYNKFENAGCFKVQQNGTIKAIFADQCLSSGRLTFLQRMLSFDTEIYPNKKELRKAIYEKFVKFEIDKAVQEYFETSTLPRKLIRYTEQYEKILSKMSKTDQKKLMDALSSFPFILEPYPESEPTSIPLIALWDDYVSMVLSDVPLAPKVSTAYSQAQKSLTTATINPLTSKEATNLLDWIPLARDSESQLRAISQICDKQGTAAIRKLDMNLFRSLPSKQYYEALVWLVNSPSNFLSVNDVIRALDRISPERLQQLQLNDLSKEVKQIIFTSCVGNGACQRATNALTKDSTHPFTPSEAAKLIHGLSSQQLIAISQICEKNGTDTIKKIVHALRSAPGTWFTPAHSNAFVSLVTDAANNHLNPKSIVCLLSTLSAKKVKWLQDNGKLVSQVKPSILCDDDVALGRYWAIKSLTTAAINPFSEAEATDLLREGLNEQQLYAVRRICDKLGTNPIPEIVDSLRNWEGGKFGVDQRIAFVDLVTSPSNTRTAADILFAISEVSEKQPQICARDLYNEVVSLLANVSNNPATPSLST